MWRLPSRIYRGDGCWEITTDEAEFVLERGRVSIDGTIESVALIAREGDRAFVSVGTFESEYRAWADSALEEGNVPTA